MISFSTFEMKTLIFLSTFAFATCIPNAMNGQHFLVISGTMTREGRINGTTGKFLDQGITSQTINFMSEFLNFTYSGVYYVKTPTDPVPGNKSIAEMLAFGEGNFAIGGFFPTVVTNKLVDLSVVFAEEGSHFLIPVPEILNNRYAVFKPFTLPVWVCCLASILIAVIALHLSNKLIDFMSSKQALSVASADDRLTGPGTYIMGIILSQGACCDSKNLAIRILAGMFCLAACVLVNSYSSLLITYVIAPYNPPLVRSVHDLLRNEDIKLLVDKDGPLDVLISKSTETKGIFKQLRDRLNKYPDSRCDRRRDCMPKVLQLHSDKTKAVYVHAHVVLVTLIKDDYAKNKNRCRMQIAPEAFFPVFACWLVPKNSPYRNAINFGLLTVNEIGLKGQWYEDYHTLPAKCKARQKSESAQNPKLSLKNLHSAFMLLIMGICLSVFVFLVELAISRLFALKRTNHKRCHRRNRSQK